MAAFATRVNTRQTQNIAYFCMEYGLHDDLPLYSGGLGVLAGDVLRAAKDAHLPLVGIGLFWSEGYVDQRLGEDGWPHDHFVPTPRTRLQALDVQVSVRIRGREVPLAAWLVSHESHAPLYLLEPRNDRDKWITRRLYQGGYGDRVAQEIVLGVGGLRLLRALKHPVEVVHLNEGHAVFAAFELIREAVADGMSHVQAIEAVRRKVVFTTHTPVVAGNEAHDVSLLVEQGVGLGVLGRDHLVALAGDPFNMTEAALRLSRNANAVAHLHAGTAQAMWAHVRDAAAIVPITNGVHVPTWGDPRFAEALLGGDPWGVHQQMKRELIDLVAERTRVRLDVDVLLIGFARRATPYKRGDLIFRDLPRVAHLLDSGKLQLVFAGKAHPDAFDGKGLIAHVGEMTRRFPKSVVFLENYDLHLGRLLTRGCDVWLNTPQRPLEASGTSGMKGALNGVPSLSVLDGWWAEACDHGVNGWQFGDGYEGPGQDEHDLRALMKVLEHEVLPCYRDRDRWVRVMRAASEMASTRFSAARMIAEYRDLLWS